MKTHLLRPEEEATMCGRTRGSYTTNPIQVDCATCRKMYESNVEWYENKMANPIEVKRVVEGNSSHIEPPLVESWSELKKLQWHAAVATLDCGLGIKVCPALDGYQIHIENLSSTSALHYIDAWTYINGVMVGANAIKSKRKVRKS